MSPFLIHLPENGQRSAIVFDTPHSGIDLPAHFRYACSRDSLMHLHDPHIEKLLEDIPQTGTPVLEALIHRTCIDLNRFDDEVNPEMIVGGWPHATQQTMHTANFLGLFPVMAGPRHQRNQDIYSVDLPLTRQDAAYRIETYHTPYHIALKDLMNEAARLHGRAMHLDIHSFYRTESNNCDIEDIVLGDMNGTTCPGSLTDLVAAFFHGHGLSVGFNGPSFSGGALIRSTASERENRYSLQIEIARNTYMDPDSLAYSPVKGQKIRTILTGLAKELNDVLKP